MGTFYAVGTFGEMLKSHIEYLIKKGLVITKSIFAKVFLGNENKNKCCGKNPKILENRVKYFQP